MVIFHHIRPSAPHLGVDCSWSVSAPGWLTADWGTRHTATVLIGG